MQDRFKQKKPNEYRVLPVGETPHLSQDHEQETEGANTQSGSEQKTQIIREQRAEGRTPDQAVARDLSESEASISPLLQNIADLQPWQAIKNATHSKNQQENARESHTDHEADRREQAHTALSGVPWNFRFDNDLQERVNDSLTNRPSDLYREAMPELTQDRRLDDRVDTQVSPPELREEFRLDHDTRQQDNEAASRAHRELTSQSTNLMLPERLAERLCELGPLEPEAVQHLYDKYCYVEKFVEESINTTITIADDHTRSDEKVHQSSHHDMAIKDIDTRLVEEQQRAQNSNRDEEITHVTANVLNQRDKSFPERKERALAQLKELERFDESAAFPDTSYVQVTLTCNHSSSSFEVSGTKPVDTREVDLPEAIKQIVEARQDRLDNKETTLPEAVQHLIHAREVDRSDQSVKEFDQRDALNMPEKEHQQAKQVRRVLPVQRDLVKEKEQDLHHEVHDKPAPEKFVLVGFYFWPTPKIEYLEFWQGYTIGEFNNWCGGVPATSAAWDAITRKDKEYHSWLDRVERKEADLHEARVDAHDERADYEHDDFDR